MNHMEQFTVVFTVLFIQLYLFAIVFAKTQCCHLQKAGILHPTMFNDFLTTTWALINSALSLSKLLFAE